MDAATFYDSLPRRSSAFTPRVSTAPIRGYTPRRVTQPQADQSVPPLTGTLTPRTLSPVPTKQSLTINSAERGDTTRASQTFGDFSQLRTPTFGHSNSRLGNLAGPFLEVPRLSSFGALQAPSIPPVTLPFATSPVNTPAVAADEAPRFPIHIQPPDDETQHVSDVQEWTEKRVSEMTQQENQMYQEKWYEVSLENAQLNQRIEQLTRRLSEQEARHLWELEQRDAYYEQQLEELAETKQKLKDLVSTMHMLEFQEAKNALRKEHAEAMRTAQVQSTVTRDARTPLRITPEQDTQVLPASAADVKAEARNTPTDSGVLSLPSFDIDSTIEAGKMFFGRLVGSMS